MERVRKEKKESRKFQGLKSVAIIHLTTDSDVSDENMSRNSIVRAAQSMRLVDFLNRLSTERAWCYRR